MKEKKGRILMIFDYFTHFYRVLIKVCGLSNVSRRRKFFVLKVLIVLIVLIVSK